MLGTFERIEIENVDSRKRNDDVMFGCDVWPSGHDAYVGVRRGGFIN